VWGWSAAYNKETVPWLELPGLGDEAVTTAS
jgi:hypothetical protein